MINSTSLLAINKSLLLCIFITVIGISLSAIIVWTIYDINPIDTESTKILPTENTKLTPIMEQKIAQIQIPFIKNEGQADSQILYYAQIFAGRVAITSDSIVYDLNSDDTKFVIKESFGNLLYPQGMEKSETDINYFVGAKENWRNHVPAYQNILVQTPWYNIDAKVISHMSNTEKIFTVHPYGNPLDILISVDGPDTLTLSENDELVMHFGQKMTSFTAPVAYQIIDGVKVHVDVSYVVFDRAYGFSVGKYDKEYDLVIDPLVASTFLGGSSADRAYAIAIDSSGIYVAGYTTDDTTDLPVTGGAYDESHNGSYDVFVSKFSSLDLSSSSTSTEISGSGCADCTPPTLGVDFNSKRMVTNGFSYNANPVDVSLYYTPYPLITANIGHNNTAEFKIYENSGVDKIRHFDFAFGLAKGQILSDSKARIEWDKKWDGTEITTLIDPNNVLQNVTISTQTISCQDTSNDQCLLLIVFHTFRESLEFDIVATNVWDEHRNAWQNYYNHGIHITGESLNPPKQYDGIDKGQIYHLTETGKNKAVDSFGNTWTFSNSWMKDYTPNQRSQDVDWQVMDRTHSDFANLVDGEIIKAQNKLLALCPECSESYEFTPSTTIIHNERINKLDDPEVQKKMAIETERAQKIMDDLMDIHDRYVEN